ncbi:Homebox and aldo/keto reductase [Phytophthora cinnamomi]|uniref:Homebox and aldo/keto reductase n=1 Tax=Phytophthora cinnamomi TaxID=4785 RepID=UPI00355A7BE7|nr:Homebox and aldo/keto reductase [Phytophthora cinnamomi]
MVLVVDTILHVFPDVQGRALPRWVLDLEFDDKKTGKKLTYLTSPKTPLIFMNHFWDSVPDTSWPASKPMYLMPNVEMYELVAAHYWRVDVVLCKTAICARRVRMWYQQKGNPQRARHTRATTSDAALYAKTPARAKAAAHAKNFSDGTSSTPLKRFLAAISRVQGDERRVGSWLSARTSSPLDVFVDQDIYNTFIRKTYDESIRAQPKVTVTRARARQHLRQDDGGTASWCTSVLEGYGHYINQARAKRR